jgi:pre-mRNA-processing factor 19
MSSFLVCAVSQKPAEVPVVSMRSGLVFEKATIEKYIDINGCCPITSEKLEHSDIIPIKSTFD